MHRNQLCSFHHEHHHVAEGWMSIYLTKQKIQTASDLNFLNTFKTVQRSLEEVLLCSPRMLASSMMGLWQSRWWLLRRRGYCRNLKSIHHSRLLHTRLGLVWYSCMIWPCGLRHVAWGYHTTWTVFKVIIKHWYAFMDEAGCTWGHLFVLDTLANPDSFNPNLLNVK